MAEKIEIPWDLRDALMAQMPPYIKGRLDQQASTRLNTAITVAIFLVFVLPLLLSFTSVGRWLAEYELAGLACIVTLVLIACWLINKWPDIHQQEITDKIIRLRVSSGQWPDIDRNYQKNFSAITEETIATAREKITAQLEKERAAAETTYRP